MKSTQTTDYNHSKFWARNIDADMAITNDLERLQKMNSYRNAISNFVSILTGKNIPVHYKTDSDSSFTDGNVVTISGKIDSTKFDSVVGLALHEGSHIVLTDFRLFRRLADQYKVIHNNSGIKDYADIPKRVFDTAEKKKLEPVQTLCTMKDLINWIEDRRIDRYIQDTAPGYVGYYEALYKRYFTNNTISMGLVSEKHRTETLDSYMFRIINMMNEYSDTKALKGLKEIFDIIDLKNINRLKNSTEARDIAIAVFEVILKNIDAKEQMTENEENAKSKSKKKNGGGSESDSDSESDDDSEIQADEIPDSLEDLDVSESDVAGAKGRKLSKEAAEKLKKMIEAQKDFLNGKVQKENISEQESEDLKTMESMDADVVNIDIDSQGNSVKNSSQSGSKTSINIQTEKVIIITNVTPDIFYSSLFPFSNKSKYRKFQTEVTRGVQLGTLLGRKLQVRNEERTTVYTRKNTGRIDRRLLHSAPFNENVFGQKFIEKYTDSMLHFSIDVSTSMNGSKISNAVTLAVALAKAVDMIQNLELQISLRGATYEENVVAVIYDSRKDSFRKLLTIMPDLYTAGGTPEGLCYDATMKHFVESNKSLKSYFLNISDGEPTYRNGVEHTRKQIELLRSKGIHIISYFVSEYGSYDSSWSNFQRMYGNDSHRIDVSNMLEVARVMNKKFLTVKD